MSLLVAIQESLDIAMHLASDEGWGLPGTYAESFEMILRHGVIGTDLGQELRGLVALRNRIAHGYASVEMERIWSELPSGLEILERFSAAIANFADPDALRE